MEKTRLGDVATVITKGTTPTSLGFDFNEDGINFIKIESITENGDFLVEKFAHIDDECNEKLKRSQLASNDILFSIAGAIGRVAIVTEDVLPANTNQALAIIRIPTGIFNYRFLTYVLQSPIIVEQFEKQKQGVAQLNLSLKDIGNLYIPQFPMPEQEQIVAVLDKVSDLIAMRKKQLQKLDDLVKSRFVEMFGTVHNNVFQFAEGTLESISYEFFAGGDKPSDCTTERDEAHPYPVFANGYENEGLQGYSAKCRVTQPAVTVSARGTIGYCFIREAGFTPVVRLITIVPNNKVSPVFLKYAIDTMDIKSSGTSQAHYCAASRLTRPVRRLRQTDRQIKIYHPAKSG